MTEKRLQAIKDTNKEETAEKCVCDDKRNLTISDEANLPAWKEHCQRHLNVEFPWYQNSLNNSAENLSQRKGGDETRKSRRTIRINSLSD